MLLRDRHRASRSTVGDTADRSVALPASPGPDRAAGVFYVLLISGVVLIASGAALDALLHARDPSLASTESLFSFGNPGHALLGTGFSAVAVGGLGMARAQARSWDGAWPKALLQVGGAVAAAALVVLGWLAATSEHRHEPATLVAEGGSSAAAARVDRSRLPAEEQSALVALSWSRGSAVEADGEGHEHAFVEPGPETDLSPGEQLLLDEQWAAAASAAARFETTADAEADGYRQTSAAVPGVGSHWIKWSLVDRPFDPAHPSMLLFDETTQGRPLRLVGFSYWVAGAEDPEGFAGPNDTWHGHQGLCFANGWLVREGVPDRADCEGDWINGTDLWMLHAWVVRDMANPWGRFAAVNPALCRQRPHTPDAMTCDPVGR